MLGRSSSFLSPLQGTGSGGGASQGQNSSFSDSGNDDSELWIAPKVRRQQSNQGGSPSRTAAPKHIAGRDRALTAPLETSRYQAGQRRRGHSAGGQRGELPSLSLTVNQMVSWYLPRVLFLFLIGWTWSVGVQFIHAEQNSVGSVAAISRMEYGQAENGRQSQGSSDEFAYYDDDAGGGRQAAGLTRDLISRALQHSSWVDALSGLLTVLVGTGYPFLDWKWRSYTMHKVDWNDVLRCVGGFLGINYAALKLPFETVGQSSMIMIIISLGLWTVCDGTLHGFLLSSSMALIATWLLYFQAMSDYASFTQDDYLGLLIGRRLGFHPHWKKYRHRHLREEQKREDNPAVRLDG
ncbi:hypothetical protein DL89DRAFT_294551 [Linderina pennispora]|uniref:INSIG-domain-containing protein n=1 Tax=Linderina pennispora TaxID=61395 RepID=A0A1Y1W3J3_9FUNG|nr:uncharacterized protein DL89DRAFT_294551 [Linderina pennispora]ORX68037.1 hypothetical protein DL89DRAFT_294551 [Linderina pennispora]